MIREVLAQTVIIDGKKKYNSTIGPLRKHGRIHGLKIYQTKAVILYSDNMQLFWSSTQMSIGIFSKDVLRTLYIKVVLSYVRLFNFLYRINMMQRN